MVKSASGTSFVTIDNTRVAGNFIGINAKDNSKVAVSNSTIVHLLTPRFVECHPSIHQTILVMVWRSD
jgi:hypothetical protein